MYIHVYSLYLIQKKKKSASLSVSILHCEGKAIVLQNPSSRSKRLLDGMGVRIG